MMPLCVAHRRDPPDNISVFRLIYINEQLYYSVKIPSSDTGYPVTKIVYKERYDENNNRWQPNYVNIDPEVRLILIIS